MNWYESLQPATLRGLPFAVLGTDARVGRRNAVHEYPYRDTIWIEDLGRAGRRIGITGFLISDSRIYGGGDVLKQRDKLIGAAEAPGDAELVHPTLGRLKVSVLGVTVSERWDRGQYIEINFDLAEAGIQTFPNVGASSPDQTVAAVERVKSSSAVSFVERLRSPLGFGGSITSLVEQVTTDWTSKIATIGADATNLFGMSSLLQGNFGAYWGGSSISPLSDIRVGLLGPLSTIRDLVVLGTTARSNIGLAATLLQAAASGLGISSATDFTIAAQGLAASLLASVSNPYDGIRAMHRAADFHPAYPLTSDAIGRARGTAQSATGDLFRRAVVAELAHASAAWEPQSFDQAVYIRQLITTSLDDEILIAGDQEEDDVYLDLKATRSAVATDLTTRAADLARMVTVRTTEPMPALAMAYRLYQDIARDAELARAAGSPHPAFLSTEYLALSA